MKTIEIEHRTLRQYKYLLSQLYKYVLKDDNYFHYFFEPKLIIRTKYIRQVTMFLTYRNIKYKVYAYPYSKKGFGENRKWKKIQKDLISLYHLQAVAALTFSKRDRRFTLNRMHHCFLNMMGNSYRNESYYYLRQARGYMYHEYKDSGKPIDWILSKLIGIVSKLI